MPDLKATEHAATDGYFTWETFLMGGLSIVTCLAFWTFMDKSASLVTLSALAAFLALFVNHVHFLSSYMLLYGDFKNQVLKRPRYFWAAVVVPLVLGGALVTAMLTRDGKQMGYIVSAMYFFVGWHYTKQIFGCVIVTSVQRRIFYSVWERRVLLANLFCVWFMSWLGSNVGQNNYDFYGITYASLGLPEWMLKAIFPLVGLTFAATAWMLVRKYINEGKKPSPPAVVAFLSLYAWYLPTLSHPGFAYLIPLFHSLQYLVFVGTLKRNQINHGLQGLNGRELRAASVRRFGGYALTAFVLGFLCFEAIPKGLDARHLIQFSTLGHSPFLAAFLLFINIHHYFIDNVIWRSDNEVVKRFLFQAPAANGPVLKEGPKAA